LSVTVAAANTVVLPAASVAVVLREFPPAVRFIGFAVHDGDATTAATPFTDTDPTPLVASLTVPLAVIGDVPTVTGYDEMVCAAR